MPKEEALQLLKTWFKQEKRNLPWRNNPSPYVVWISEVMLQQTQVSVVIPFFERWMQRFPNLEALAKSDLSLVLKQWEGLGYYSRAKNLHRAARYVYENHLGEIPLTYEELIKIPGLGPYTIGAIRAFAFKQRALAIDGNVLRVIARYAAIQDDISQNATKKKITQLTDAFLPQEEAWIVSEALIELGAIICKKKPLCALCPIQQSCQSYHKNLTTLIPFKESRATTTSLHRTVAIIITSQNEILIRKVPPGEIMAGLHEFPYIQRKKKRDVKNLKNQFEEKFKLDLTLSRQLLSVTHHFTRFKAHLEPFVFHANFIKNLPETYFWASLEELNLAAFSSGHRRILQQLAS